MKSIISSVQASAKRLGKKCGYCIQRIGNGLPQTNKGLFFKNPHFWIISALVVIVTFLYYVDRILPNVPILAGVHDLQRTVFFIPIIYAALVFRIWGSFIGSAVFLCAVIPRAILISPYPDPLLRPLVFVGIATITSLLIATQLNRIEQEARANAELKAAYTKLEDSQQQLIQAEKLSSLGQLAASIAHEINNPLAGALAYTQLSIRKMKSDNISWKEALEYLHKVEMEITRSGKLVRNLLDFARQSPPSLDIVDVNEVIEQALDLSMNVSKRKNIELIKEFIQPLPGITADFNQLQQVFVNLILNAIQAMSEGGMLTIRTTATEDGIKIEVGDTGCGIPPENIPKLFTPFFTTKKEVKGVGLGLAVTYGIVHNHRGKIDVRSKPGSGSVFTVFLPLKLG